MTDPTTQLDLDAIEAVVRNAALIGADINPATAAALVAEIHRLRAELATARVQIADEGMSGPCDCGEGAVHYTTADCPAAQRVTSHCGTPHYQHPETVCTEPTGHYQPIVDPHAGPLILDGRECGRAAWDEPTAARPDPTA